MSARRGRPTAVIVLDDEERETLERWARRPKSSQALALRCRIVLGAAEGRYNKDIAAELGCHPATAAKWRSRFAERRFDGLCDDPRPGPPRTIDDAAVERVIVLTLRVRAIGRDALVDAVDGQSGGHLAVVGARHLGGVRAQAPPRRGVQAVPGPAVRRQGPRRRGAVPQPPRGRGRAVRGRKDTDPGPGPHRPDPAADARHAPAAHPRLPPPRHHQPVRGARHRLGQRHHVDDGAAPLRRIQQVLEPHRQRSPLPPRRARRGSTTSPPTRPPPSNAGSSRTPASSSTSPPPTAPG